MPKEKEAYRPTLEVLRERFPGVLSISVAEAAEVYGMSERTLRRDATFPIDSHGRVPLVRFARWLS